MQVKNMEDVREAVRRMARHNRVSVTGLNDIADIGAGVLTRLVREEVPSRPRNGESVSTVVPDIKLSTFIRAVNAAGWEMVLQPISVENRRARVRAAARNGQEVPSGADEVSESTG